MLGADRMLRVDEMLGPDRMLEACYEGIIIVSMGWC